MRARLGINTRGSLTLLQTSVGAYKYRSLPSKTSLRLLKVQPDGHGSVSCSLEIFPLNEAPPFSALSYTWSYPWTPSSVQTVQAKLNQLERRNGLYQKAKAPRPSFNIACDNQTMRVTANLHDALVALARHKGPDLLRENYVWVDAISIDQANLAERNQQVSFMSDIFTAAQGVVVWLGDEDEFTRDALTVIERISSSTELSWKSIPYTGFYGDRQCYTDVGMKPLSYKNWLGFLAFINRSWFKRSWVVQELALARSATVVCGSRSISWEKLAKTIVFIKETRWYHHLSTEKLRHVSEVRQNPGIYKKFLKSKTWFDMTPIYLNRTRNAVQSFVQGHSKRSPPLRVLIDTHRNTKTSEPRDKVYAFLSLADHGRYPFTKGTDPIKPDYSLPVSKIFTQVAWSLIRSYRNIHLLSHVQDQSLTRIANLPSWVPDYTVSIQPYPLEFRGNCDWSSCGDVRWTPPSNDEVEQTGLLPVQGFHIDTVSETACMPQEAEDASQPWASIVDMTSHLPEQYYIPTRKDGAPISRFEVLWRTLITNTYSRQHPAPSHCGTLLIDYILNLQIRHRLAPWSSSHREFQPHQTAISTLTNPEWRNLLAAEPAYSPYSLQRYRDRLTALVENMLSKDAYSPIELAQLHHDVETGSGRNRRLFRTKDFNLLGTGARSLRKGDEVWILAGGRVPYILRRAGSSDAGAGGGESRHRLIGEAYVHGVMHGDPRRLGRELSSTLLE